jgi:radical SAM protein with 4Fe4S-binding SPASM domain
VSADGGLHACPRFVAGTGDRTADGRPLLQITRPSADSPPAAGLALPDLLPLALRMPPPTCAGCSWLGSCGGGCTLAGQGTSRAAALPDPHCTSYMAIHAALFGTVISSYLAGRHRGSQAFNGARPREVSL